ncbi:MAG: META domain-containing protein [Burkholderiales bacterium]|nr:MAG: META domain-containing protein [Burkholderiales bacterium]
MEKTIVSNGSAIARIRTWEVIAAIALIGLVVLTALSCTSPPNDTVKLEGVTWVLKSYGEAANPTQAISGHQPTLTFDKGTMKAGGNGGVNGYGGDYTLDGNKLKFGSIVHTLMASTNEALNIQESAFFKIMDSAASFKIEAGQLTISGSEGILVFSQK